MTIQELYEKCWKQQQSQGRDDALVTLILPGRWGKTGTKRIAPGWPVGTIVSDHFNGDRKGVVVMFRADEIEAHIVRHSLLELEAERQILT